MSNLVQPINFKKWVDDNRHLLKPPVSNKVVWEDASMIIMVVGGPNSRKDYHYNETPEFFYQIEGNMILKIKNGDNFEDVPIKEGEIYLLPPKIPHSPQRFAGTIGLVVEQKRDPHHADAMQWYCENCSNMIHRATFNMKNIVTELPPVMKSFFADENLRTCSKCGTVMQPPN
jgi:3-hydroxyanthranilate 3,4-dioxygenase